LPEFFIKLLSPEDGLVCDPFGGSGTTGIVATKLSRRCLLIENNESYSKTAVARLKKEGVIVIEDSTPNKNGAKPVYSIPADTAEQVCFFEKPPVYKTNGRKVSLSALAKQK
jgi:DNA modification methylase